MKEDPLEKGMATHSSVIAWSIPWTEGPGGLQSMRSPRVRHDLATTKALCFCVIQYRLRQHCAHHINIKTKKSNLYHYESVLKSHFKEESGETNINVLQE